MANEIVTEIRLDLDKLRADLKQSAEDAKKAGKESGENLGGGIEEGLGKAVGGMKAAFAAAAAAIGAVFTLKESIAAAVEQENAINSLNSAMALSGTYSAAASQHFLDFSSALQKTTIYADEVIQQGGAMLVTLGKLSGDGLDRATKASLDMASALGMDASTAFNLVAKAAAGHTAALSRYGITVRQTGDQTRDFANALDALEKKFKGFAELQTGTFEGAMKQTKNQFGEVLESLGNIVIKSPTVIFVMNALAKAFANVADAITEWAKGRDIIGELVKLLIDVGHNLVTYLIAPAEFAFNLFRTGVLAIATLFTGLITILSTVRWALMEYLIKPVTDFVGGVFGKLVSLVDEDLGKSITSFVTTATAATTDGLKTVRDVAADVTSTLAAETEKAANGVFTFDVAAASDGFLNQATEFFDTVTPPVKANFQKISDDAKAAMGNPGFFTFFAEGFISATKSMENAAKQLGAQIYSTIQMGVTNAFAAMGAALVKGENGFAAFGKAMIGVLGDIAIQAGSTFIGLGIAKSIASLGSDPSAYALIAAGGALAVLGGALKAYAGGGGGGPAAATPSGDASGGGGGVAAGGGTGMAPANSATTLNEPERKDIGTKVEVNIAGNVLDRRETGMHIADVINETFGSNGITFATGSA